MYFLQRLNEEKIPLLVYSAGIGGKSLHHHSTNTIKALINEDWPCRNIDTYTGTIIGVISI